MEHPEVREKERQPAYAMLGILASRFFGNGFPQAERVKRLRRRVSWRGFEVGRPWAGIFRQTARLAQAPR
jgi:hypothetical protein